MILLSCCSKVTWASGMVPPVSQRTMCGPSCWKRCWLFEKVSLSFCSAVSVIKVSFCWVVVIVQSPSHPGRTCRQDEKEIKISLPSNEIQAFAQGYLLLTLQWRYTAFEWGSCLTEDQEYYWRDEKQWSLHREVSVNFRTSFTVISRSTCLPVRISSKNKGGNRKSET